MVVGGGKNVVSRIKEGELNSVGNYMLEYI